MSGEPGELVTVLHGVRVQAFTAFETGADTDITVMVRGYRYLTARNRAQIELADAEQHGKLAEECRRLADMAITAQEHTDRKLRDVSAQLDYLSEQNESLQKILKEVK